MAKRKGKGEQAGDAPKKELPSLFCAKGKHWVPSLEKHNVFATVDGAAQPMSVWTCPACRGEATTEQQLAAVDAAPKSQADLVREEKRGPRRRVMKVLESISATRDKVELECGHTRTAAKDQKNARCRKCRKKGAANGD